MKSEKLQNAIGEIKDFYIQDAHSEKVHKIASWKKMGAVAACLCLCAACLLGVFGMRAGSSSADSSEYAYDTTEGYVSYKMSQSNSLYEVSDEAYEEDMSFDYNGSSLVDTDVASINQTVQKIIITANITLETMDFDSTANRLTELVEQYNGYIESSSRGCYDYAYGDYTIRVPSEKYTAFAKEIETIGNVTYQNEYREDISESYYDIQGRLETQQKKLTRLQELLSQASSMEDIITIESEISNVEYMIELYTGELKTYDSQVDYSTIYLNVQEVYKYSGQAAAPIGFWQRLGSNFSSGWNRFVTCLESISLFIAQAWVFILVLAVIVIVVVHFCRKKKRKQ